MLPEKDDEREDEDQEEPESEGGEQVREEDGESVDVDVSGLDEPADKKTRRRQRYNELEASNRNLEQQFQEYRARTDAMLLQMAQGSRPTGEKPADDTDAKIGKLREQRQAKLKLIASGAGDENVLAALMQESQDIADQIDELRFQQRMAKHAPQQQTQQESVPRQMLQTEFPELYSQTPLGQRMQQWAMGRYSQLVAAGEPTTIETARKANREAMKAFGKGPPPPRPSAAQAQRFGAPPSQAGGSPAADKVKLTGKLKKLASARARVMDPNGDESEGIKKAARSFRKAGIV